MSNVSEVINSFEEDFGYVERLVDATTSEDVLFVLKDALPDYHAAMTPGMANHGVGNERGHYRQSPSRLATKHKVWTSIVNHVFVGWCERKYYIPGWPTIKLPPLLPWNEIAIKWNETHPDDRMNQDSLKKAFYRHREDAGKYFIYIELMAMPLEQLQKTRDIWHEYVTMLDRTDLARTEKKKYLYNWRDWIVRSLARAELLEYMIAQRQKMDASITSLYNAFSERQGLQVERREYEVYQHLSTDAQEHKPSGISQTASRSMCLCEAAHKR